MQLAPGLDSIGEKKGGNVHAHLIDDNLSLTLIDTLFEADASVVLDRAGGEARHRPEADRPHPWPPVLPWRTRHPPQVAPCWPGLTLDNDQNLKSVGKLAGAGEVEIVCVGHGGPITQGGSDILRKLRDGQTPVGAIVADDVGT